MRTTAPILENTHVRLEPIAPNHREGLRRAAGTDPSLFAYMPATLTGEGFDLWFEASLVQPHHTIWTVIEARTREPIGSTRYLNTDADNKRTEIGYTWYARSAWGGPVNPSCKLLLFQYGFETLGYNRIELKTDARNARSRAAIAKLGATEEGIFRRHMIVQGGHVRDTVYFSVIAEEWPAVKARLHARLL